ncbi:MAG: hypothetical protein M3016_09680 [Actinomycetota bacterium]|nr:hypothetical protein [Actinomycetota bacterium]
MELRHVAPARRRTRLPISAPRLALALAVLAASLLGGLGLTTPLAAAGTVSELTTAEPSGTPVLVNSLTKRPPGYHLTAARVLRIASADPLVRAKLAKHPGALPYEYTKSVPTWQVSWFSRGRKAREVVQVYVDDQSARVTQVWSGFQVAWSMARGYPGAFGRRSNALYVWLPLCLLFLAPFLPWRGSRRRPRLGRPGLLHLDLLMLLGFSVSLACFNRGEIGLSVPLVYPFLLYLLGRMLLLAFGRGLPRGPLRVAVPVPWLLWAAVFLLGLRVGLNILNSNVIDVGYAGVIGADKLIHGHLLYGLWPKDNAFGDTYGPVNYLVYVPFRLIFGWSGRWDALPAAHAAAISFDLLTAGGLYLLGRRLRGSDLGVVLMYAWVAYPFTLFTLSSNSNDALVSATVVLALLVIGSAPGRGVVGALAGLTKFAPFALAPLLLRGSGPRPKERAVALYLLAFAVMVFVAAQPVLLNGDLDYLWRDSIAYQARRVTPFSIWGLWGGLGVVQHGLELGAAALAVLLAFIPRRRGPVQVAALGAAILIAVQLTANYWLYPYILWFFPLVTVALFASHAERPASAPTRPTTEAQPVASAPAPLPA